MWKNSPKYKFAVDTFCALWLYSPFFCLVAQLNWFCKPCIILQGITETAFSTEMFYKQECLLSKFVKGPYFNCVYWFGAWGFLGKNSIVLVIHFFPKSPEKWMSKIWLVWMYILMGVPYLKFCKTFLPKNFWD